MKMTIVSAWPGNYEKENSIILSDPMLRYERQNTDVGLNSVEIDLTDKENNIVLYNDL